MEFMISDILIECFAFPGSSDEKLLEDFNWSFIQAWRTTHNYKQWRITSHSGIEEITSGLVLLLVILSIGNQHCNTDMIWEAASRPCVSKHGAVLY